MGRFPRRVKETSEIDDPIGGEWIIRRYELKLVQSIRIRSGIAATRSVVYRDGKENRFYQEASRPGKTLADHLEFMLKHEHVHLELLSRLFERLSGDEIDEWVSRHPTSKYARRAGFFYEWLTGRTLSFAGVVKGGYIHALEPNRYLTGVGPDVPRWRVRANLLGDRQFCPIVIRTEGTDSADRLNVSENWKEIEREFGEETLRRSAVWITLKESRSSFAIEHEGEERDRIKRFAAVIELHTGRYEDPLSEEAIEKIQRAIVGEKSLTYGLRDSPVFVGESNFGENVVHYIAPAPENVPGMLRGLRRVLSQSEGLGTAVRAALLSFGLVYIHPFADGNGRMSRFLINDVLRRDDAVPEPFVLPVSAAILRNMGEYDAALEHFSKPFMARYATDWRFGKSTVRYPDGLTSDFHFAAYTDALHAWKYPDLTEHVEYTYRLIKRTLDVEMREEARILVTVRQAREAVKNVFEGPDTMIDRIVRSIKENGWVVSNKLRSEFPILEDPAIADEIVQVVQEAFEGRTL